MEANQSQIDINLRKLGRPKIAVVGTGAAALGALTALLGKPACAGKQSDFDIVVYDVGKQVTKAISPDSPSEEWIVSYYNKVYREIRSLYPFKFPPPKTHLGKQIARQSLGKRLNIFKSETFGGLTNYWGATMLPFADQEMQKWPISKETLYPHYQKIAEIVGLAARPDALNEYFVHDFSTRPPIKPTYILSRLDEVVNQHQNQRSFKIISGLNRCGVETRDDHLNHCFYCGECLAGCFHNSIYSARMTIAKYLKDPRVKKFIKARVRQIKNKNRSLEIQAGNGQLESGFSKVFLCAGCPASTEIVMRSLSLREKLVMADNAVYVFPIFYFGRRPPQTDGKSYLSLCNIIFGCLPKSANQYFAQVQIYPNFDYLWRYNIPPKLWPIIRSLVSFLRSHIFWGRLYTHSYYSQAYSLELKNDQLAMDESKKAEPGKYVKALMSSIRGAVNHEKFYIPPISAMRQKVNSHYTSTLPFGGKIVKVSSVGEVMPNVYLCDSSCFPDSPAINPGFTIMANASRIAQEVLD